MSNIWYAINEQGTRVAEFLSRDYDPDELVTAHGAVAIIDGSDGHRWVDSIRPESLSYGRGVRAVRG